MRRRGLTTHGLHGCAAEAPRVRRERCARLHSSCSRATGARLLAAAPLAANTGPCEEQGYDDTFDRHVQAGRSDGEEG